MLVSVLCFVLSLTANATVNSTVLMDPPVPLCENDPMQSPYYNTYGEPPYYNPCTTGMVLSPLCKEGAEGAYRLFAKQIELLYRQAVCDCWAAHPNEEDESERYLCIYNVTQDTFQAYLNLVKFYQEYLDDCCTAEN